MATPDGCDFGRVKSNAVLAHPLHAGQVRIVPPPPARRSRPTKRIRRSVRQSAATKCPSRPQATLCRSTSPARRSPKGEGRIPTLRRLRFVPTLRRLRFPVPTMVRLLPPWAGFPYPAALVAGTGVPAYVGVPAHVGVPACVGLAAAAQDGKSVSRHCHARHALRSLPQAPGLGLRSCFIPSSTFHRPHLSIRPSPPSPHSAPSGLNDTLT